MTFKIPFRLTKFDEQNITIINQIIDYINRFFKERIKGEQVTFTTSMNADVAGEVGDIVRCSTDNKFYGCTVSGVAGSATWVSFN